jgi:hypothetical protein
LQACWAIPVAVTCKLLNPVTRVAALRRRPSTGVSLRSSRISFPRRSLRAEHTSGSAGRRWEAPCFGRGQLAHGLRRRPKHPGTWLPSRFSREHRSAAVDSSGSDFELRACSAPLRRRARSERVASANVRAVPEPGRSRGARDPPPPPERHALGGRRDVKRVPSSGGRVQVLHP